MTHTIATHFDPGLVLLSVGVAIVAAYAALDLVQRSGPYKGARWRAWIAAAGFTMGLGIWSMHFIGMLSLRMGMPVSYNGPLLILSLLAAMLGAGGALAVVARRQVTTRGLLSAAGFMGLAIAVMHYLGMASIEMEARIQWNLALIALSLAIGLGASLFALWLVMRIRSSDSQLGVGRRLLAAGVLGIGTAGLHYTGMAAATFEPSMSSMVAHGSLGSGSLVVLLGFGVAVTLAVLIGGSAVDQRRAALAMDLALVSRLARDLGHNADARRRTCEAIRELARADLVALIETGPDRQLSVTAADGAETGLGPALVDRPEVRAAAGEVSRVFVPDLGRGEILGAPGGSALFETVSLDGRPVGVVAVLWGRRQRRLPDRTESLLGMLTAEAAVAIDREDLLARLDFMARRDELTGLVNRRVLREELDREVAIAGEARPLSIAMVDIDDFKGYNDNHGHQAGDRLLRAAAAGWEDAVREGDTIARYGGDEFLIILPDCTPGLALQIAERLRLAVPAGATCSAGLASWKAGQSASLLIGAADECLYRAKQGGRDRVCAGPAAPAVGG
ncbi:MAG: diguanylate cyclase [Solirubrobacterales bacterium]|nr:diguanylate cyclase [Solirubrobacterales bacterium]